MVKIFTYLQFTSYVTELHTESRYKYGCVFSLFVGRLNSHFYFFFSDLPRVEKVSVIVRDRFQAKMEEGSLTLYVSVS